MIALGPLTQTLPAGALGWLAAGGFIYSVGAFVFERPNPYPGPVEHHELWHFLVLAGSTCHFFLLSFYVLPAQLALG